MSQQTTNLRVKRTQKLLREALIELIEERGFDRLTVKEITERAMVSRAAFYRNYQDKYDLIEQIFAETIHDLFHAVAEPSTEHPPQIWVTFFAQIVADERLYAALLGRQGSTWFVMRMRAMMIELLKTYQWESLWQLTPDRPVYPTTDDFVPNLVTTMMVEAIRWWLEEGLPYTPEEMTNRCALLLSAIFKETSTWE